MSDQRPGPVVYRGGHHITTCDSDGWHRDRFKDGRSLRSCRCENWAGGCPIAKEKSEPAQGNGGGAA